MHAFSVTVGLLSATIPSSVTGKTVRSWTGTWTLPVFLWFSVFKFFSGTRNNFRDHEIEVSKLCLFRSRQRGFFVHPAENPMGHGQSETLKGGLTGVLNLPVGVYSVLSISLNSVNSSFKKLRKLYRRIQKADSTRHFPKWPMSRI
jgi:hypothetical protein